jgi:hypothetical protein
MGRELRRKQAKKEGKSLERENITETNPIKKYLLNIFVIVGVFAIIYLVSALFITKELDWFNKDKSEEKEKNNVSNAILASAIFKQSEEEYYVYFYDFNEEEKDSEITKLVDNNLMGDKVYKVNTKSAMNTNYVSEESNKNAKTLSELKVVSPTLIKISGDTITEYYEKKEIINKLS